MATANASTAPPVSAGSYNAPAAPMANQAPAQTYGQQQTPYYAAKPAGIPLWRWPAGIVAAIVVGVVGAVIWEKVTIISGINIGYLAAGIGFLVGLTMSAVSQRTGILAGGLSALIAFSAQILGHILLIQEYTVKSDPSLAGQISLMDIIHVLPQAVGPIGWIIIAIGTSAAYRIPMGAHRR